MRVILIHTSVKLVTCYSRVCRMGGGILIHTSVKLVTPHRWAFSFTSFILIHTSVKLVTESTRQIQARRWYFNPHEREARDEDVTEKALEARKF